VVEVERGVYGSLPYAAVGGGPPLVVFAGLMPVTGVGGDAVVNPQNNTNGRRMKWREARNG
jgi:hypothetical protein